MPRALLLALVIALAGCGSDNGQPAPTADEAAPGTISRAESLSPQQENVKSCVEDANEVYEEIQRPMNEEIPWCDDLWSAANSACIARNDVDDDSQSAMDKCRVEYAVAQTN